MLNNIHTQDDTANDLQYVGLIPPTNFRPIRSGTGQSLGIIDVLQHNLFLAKEE